MDDDFTLSEFAELFDSLDSDGDPTPRGIMQCLRMLSEEAATLGMSRTLAALRGAMNACAEEGDDMAEDEAAAEADTALPSATLTRPPGTRLH